MRRSIVLCEEAFLKRGAPASSSTSERRCSGLPRARICANRGKWVARFELTSLAYATIYAELNDAFHVGRYADIPEAEWPHVTAWLQTRRRRAPPAAIARPAIACRHLCL